MTVFLARLAPFAILCIALSLSSAGGAGAQDPGPASEGSEPVVEAPADPKAEPPEWNSAIVTRLANDLAETLREAYQSAQSAPPQQTAFQQRERDAAQGVIRRSRDLAVDLASRLSAGGSRPGTDPYFRAVESEVEYIFETAGTAVPSDEARARVERIQSLLGQLRAYYDAR